MTRLAKLILHFNTPDLTASLCRMVPGAIVIDNGSTIRPYKGQNRTIRQENYGFTKGWNEGIRAVYEEFDAFWLMNSDIIITPKCIDRVEAILNEQPEVLFLTPSYNCWMKHCQTVKMAGLVETGVMEFTAPVIRKEVFERLGFFDEIFERGYGVEFDYCYKARQAGIKMYIDHQSNFYHLGQQTINKNGGLLAYSKKANFELTHGLITRYGHGFRKLVFGGLNIKSDFDMKIAVYVTIFGDYDGLKPIPAQEVKADYFVITDNPKLKLEGWKTVVPNFPRRDLHPRLRAKFFKMFPWECDEMAKYELSIYIDASIRITSANFIATCLKNLNQDMLLFRHPQRQCIYKEGAASVGLKKYDGEPINEQLNFYRKFHPANGGLYACGLIVRKHTEQVKKIMGDWWFENIKYSYQDQLSLPVILRANGFTPSTFAEDQYKNNFLQVEWHDDRAKDVVPQELITVLMPVWKTPVDLLKRAIDSIINQTDRNFELLIVDDNNGERRLLDLLFSYLKKDDQRVRIIHTSSNEGLAKTLDFGIGAAKGELIIRMDSDDVAKPELVARHRQFFAEHQGAAICGVQINLMYKTGAMKGVSSHPAVVTKEYALSQNKFWMVNHPGICYRKSVVTALGGYGDTPRMFAEDYALWCKFLKAGYEIYNLPDVLIDYTLGDGSQLGQDREGAEWKAFLTKAKVSLQI
jgi:GT2 family glycosyltransferase